MASCNLKETSCDTGPKGTGSATFKYELETDSVILSPLTALAIGRGLGVPQHGAQLDDAYWFAQNFKTVRNESNRKFWFIDAIFSPPPEGEDDAQQVENPLERPAVYDVQYIEKEIVIREARNRQAFGAVFTRAIGTLGPIVNAAYRRPDEPIVDTVRNAVIVIEKNYATLGAIMSLNETFQLTTNSDTCTVGGESIAANRLKYLGTFSGGRQQEGDVVYYPGRTEIELMKSTDRTLDNVGYEFWNPTAEEYERAKDKDEEYTADPVNLDLGGEFGGDTLTTIDWYYLQEVAYATFFS